MEKILNFEEILNACVRVAGVQLEPAGGSACLM